MSVDLLRAMKFTFETGFEDLVRGREHVVSVTLDLEPTADHDRASDDWEHVQVSIVESEPDSQRTIRCSPIAVQVLSESRKAAGDIRFVPANVEDSHRVKLHVRFEVTGAPAATPVEFAIGEFPHKPLNAKMVVEDMLDAGELRRLPPAWNPVAIRLPDPLTKRQAFSNVLPRCLLPPNVEPDESDDIDPAVSPRLRDDLATLLTEALDRVVSDEGEYGRIRIVPYVGQEPAESPDLSVADRSAGVDACLNGKSTGAGLVTELSKIVARRHPDWLAEPGQPALEIIVAAFASDRYLEHLMESSQPGIAVFGFCNPTPANKTAVDLSALWTRDPTRASSRRERLRDIPLAQGLSMHKWFEASGVAAEPPEQVRMPGWPVADAGIALAQSAEVLEGYFVASDGRVMRRWLSLPECQDALQEFANQTGPELVRNGCRDLVSHLAQEIERNNTQTGREPRHLAVLNLCSPTSKICSGFDVLSDRRRWDPAEYVGTVEMHNQTVRIRESETADLITGVSPTLVVLFVPIDSYEVPINHVDEYVKGFPNNQLMVVISLFSLNLGDFTTARVGNAPVIPLVELDVNPTENSRSVAPVGELPPLNVLYPWLAGGRQS